MTPCDEESLARTRIDAPTDFDDRIYDSSAGTVIDVINGAIPPRAALVGLQAPVNATITALVKACEEPSSFRLLYPDEAPLGEKDRNERELLEKARDQRWTIEQLEREYILDVLESVHGHRGHAADILGIDRRTLYRKLKEYQVETEDEMVEV